jgi:hypothetical protein
LADWLFPSRLIVKQMSPKSRKILITTESREIFIVRTNDKSFVSGFCGDCAKEVELLNLDSAVSFTEKSARQLIVEIQSKRGADICSCARIR